MSTVSSSPPYDVPAASAREQLRRGVWITRAYYFTYFAALGAMLPLFVIYLDARGMTGVQIGLLSSLPPLISLASNPFWGGVADWWQAHQRVLALCAAVAGVGALAFIAVDTFLGILVVLCIVNFFRAPIVAILDSTAMGFVATSDVSYGQMRAFGSLGWIVTSLSIGILVGITSLDAIFWLYAVLLGVVCTILSLNLPIERAVDRVSLRTGLGILLRQRVYRSLLVSMALFGAGFICQANFTSLYVIVLGGSTALVGITNASTAFFEMPVLFWGHRLIARFGYRTMILAAYTGFALAWLLAAGVSAPWQLALLTGMTGLFFALYLPAIVNYANRSAPAGMSASAQAFAQAAQGGLGWAVGSVMSGVLWEWGGGPALYLTAATLVAVGGVFFAVETRSDREPSPGPVR